MKGPVRNEKVECCCPLTCCEAVRIVKAEGLQSIRLTGGQTCCEVARVANAEGLQSKQLTASLACCEGRWKGRLSFVRSCLTPAFAPALMHTLVVHLLWALVAVHELWCTCCGSGQLLIWP
eukprot:1157605-Pelagomonas_calceolata.AAC.11